MSIDFSADTESVEVQDNRLGEVSKLAHALVAADVEVAQAEQQLKVLKENARRIREEALPSAMEEIGLTKVVLDTGETVGVKQDVYASIPVRHRDEAYSWLEEHGFGSLIKTEVISTFGRGQLAEAQDLAEDLINRGLSSELKRGVHAQTLKAFLREQLEAGTAVPLDIFGARPVSVATVKKGK